MATKTKPKATTISEMMGGKRSPEPVKHTGVKLDVPRGSTKGGKTVKDKIAMEEVGTKKERMTVHIPENLINEVKNSVYWTPGMTLAELAETAFSNELKRMEKKHGKPFPQRGAELKTGRPIKVS